MRHLRITGCVVLAWLLTTVPGRGQPFFPVEPNVDDEVRARSHIDIPSNPVFDKADLERRLKDFKVRVQSQKKIDGFAKAQKLLDSLPEAQRNEAKKLVEPLMKLVENNDREGAEKYIEQLKQQMPELKKLLEQMQSGMPMLPDGPGPDTPDPDPRPPTTPDKAQVRPLPPPVPVNRLTPEELAQRTEFAEWLLKQARQLENTSLGQSPLVRQLGRDLERYAREGLLAGQRASANNPFLQKMINLSQGLRPSAMWSRIGLPDMPSLYVPGFNTTLPRFRPPAPAPGLAVPRLRPQTPDVGVGVTLLGVLVVLTLGLALWRLLALYRPHANHARAEKRYLGKWPVRPDDIRDGQDLILAFEHLSLCRLGVEVRTWNHREIAAALGCTDPEENRLAQLLADLYEQARYAPAGEPIPEEVLPSARRALASLAGTSAS
ncbi:MAG: hypothetical protein AB7K24_12680 [Gemmataceae bacterium]